jgi:hypothetical protein
MTDAKYCAQLSLGEPMVSLAALVELRGLLDVRQAGQDRVTATEHGVELVGIPESGNAVTEGESPQEVSDDSTTKA